VTRVAGCEDCLASGEPRKKWDEMLSAQGTNLDAFNRKLALDHTAPAILELKAAGHRGVFVQPIGFLCDHVEVLYDIDIGFQEFAEKEGMQLRRAESLNDSPLLTAALADLVSTAIGADQNRSRAPD
jgi:hypothetical protein